MNREAGPAHSLVDAVVALSRKTCGCVQCQGGYQIGRGTIASPAQPRPTSCLASVLLDWMLDNLPNGDELSDLLSHVKSQA